MVEPSNARHRFDLAIARRLLGSGKPSWEAGKLWAGADESAGFGADLRRGRE
jgi:hypothetical protein